MHVRLLKVAECDLDEGYTFYESQEIGLGDYFLNSLFADIDSLVIFAGIHRMEKGSYRMLSHKFPYAIYYDVVDQDVLVWAIVDCRRSPVIKARKFKQRR